MITIVWATFRTHNGNKFDVLAVHSRHAHPLTNGTRRARNRHKSASERANAAHTSAHKAGELGHPQGAGPELAEVHTAAGRMPDACAACQRGRAAGASPPRRRRRPPAPSAARDGSSGRYRRSRRRLRGQDGVHVSPRDRVRRSCPHSRVEDHAVDLDRDGLGDADGRELLDGAVEDALANRHGREVLGDKRRHLDAWLPAHRTHRQLRISNGGTVLATCRLAIAIIRSGSL
mmetsp:Transcript_69958/g.210184  ORF Transcript_69958/g.210184 Transcript_69958/m.210184 type:complete len:232 (+) Transcript_69958:27-722(+)